MRLVLLPLVGLILGVFQPALASAGEGSAVLEPGSGKDAAARARYVQDTQELEKLAQKNAWTGAERTFRDMQDLGVALSFNDYYLGAHAARATGDITSTRQRLMAANKVREDKGVLDWMWEIDSNYGVVYLAADPGAVPLEPEAMPFDPVQASAVTFAQQCLAQQGVFEGYLPQGNYQFGPHKVPVQPRVQATNIDLRTEEGQREVEKIKKKDAKKKKAAQG